VQLACRSHVQCWATCAGLWRLPSSGPAPGSSLCRLGRPIRGMAPARSAQRIFPKYWLCSPSSSLPPSTRSSRSGSSQRLPQTTPLCPPSPCSSVRSEPTPTCPRWCTGTRPLRGGRRRSAVGGWPARWQVAVCGLETLYR